MNVRKERVQMSSPWSFWFKYTERELVFLIKWLLHLQRILDSFWKRWWLDEENLWTWVYRHNRRIDLRIIFIVLDVQLIVIRPSKHLVFQLSNLKKLLFWLSSIRECNRAEGWICRSATWHKQPILSLLLKVDIFGVLERIIQQWDRFMGFILQVSFILISLLLLISLIRKCLVHLNRNWCTFIDELSNVAIDIFEFLSIDFWELSCGDAIEKFNGIILAMNLCDLFKGRNSGSWMYCKDE